MFSALPIRPAAQLAQRLQRGLLLIGFVATSLAHAQSNIDPAHAFAWSGNIGWINWRPDAQNGADITEFVCSGLIYSANVGWINLGNGKPANGTHYQNNSASDFGVNVTPSGELEGFAYGANIGWIAFEPTGSPRIDLRTGTISGYAYSANAGWVTLGDTQTFLKINSLNLGDDSDADGLPDAWEMLHAGNLTTYSRTGDHDADGVSDYAEYLAGTDPNNANDFFRITRLDLSPDRLGAGLTWTAVPNREYQVQVRNSFSASDAWQDVGNPVTAGTSSPTLKNTVPRGTNSLQFFRVVTKPPLGQ